MIKEVKEIVRIRTQKENLAWSPRCSRPSPSDDKIVTL